jgi:hypothetical protein
MIRSALVGLVLVSVSSADTVVMKSGARLKGAATVEGETVFVRVGCGLVRVSRADVAQIIESRSAVEEYEARAAEAKDANAHLALADWCASERLVRPERLELEAVLAAEPEHAAARARLGYEKVGKEWLRGEALLKARGFVRHDGAWMTPEEATAAQAVADEARMVRAERESARLDTRIAWAKERIRRRAYAQTVARMNYRPMSRYRDRDRGLGYVSWKNFGYRIGPRNAPGHIVGIGGWIRPFDLYGEWYLPW